MPQTTNPRPFYGTADEHIAWAKQRALEYVDRGDLTNALSSLTSDLHNHPDTAQHPAIELGTMLAFGGHLRTAKEMRDWIEGVQ